MPDAWRYDGLSAVVTGGASGMGEATARLLIELGADVTVLDVQEPKAQSGRYVPVDLGDRRSIESATAQISRPVHALFNCAGRAHGPGWPPIKTLLVNFIGLRYLTDRVVPLMLAGSGIVSVGTMLLGFWDPAPEAVAIAELADFDEARVYAEAQPEAMGDGYRFSKQCLSTWTMRQVVPMGARGIRINCVGPGPTATPLMSAFEANSGKEKWDRLNRPLGRNSTALEQAAPLVFLNSRAASIITGALVQTDGGMMASMLSGLEAIAAPGYEQATAEN